MHQWINCDSALINDRTIRGPRFNHPFAKRPTTSKARPTSEGYCGTYFFHTADDGEQTQRRLVQRYRMGAGIEPNVEASIERMRGHRASGTAFVLGKSHAPGWSTNHPLYTYTGERPNSRTGLSDPGAPHTIPATSDVVLRDNSHKSVAGCRQNFLTLMAKPPPTPQRYYRVPSEAEKAHARHVTAPLRRETGGSGPATVSKDEQIASLRAKLTEARAQASAGTW